MSISPSRCFLSFYLVTKHQHFIGSLHYSCFLHLFFFFTPLFFELVRERAASFFFPLLASAMGFFSNIFKDKKKDHSRNASAHEHHLSHHDPQTAESGALEPLSQQEEVAPVKREASPHKHATPHAEHSKEIRQHPNEQLSPPEPATQSAQHQEAPPVLQHSSNAPPPQHCHTSEREKTHQQRTQAPQRQQVGLKPAYCYTGGQFSETISKEEARLAKEYNFAASEDRAHAEVIPSTTRRTTTQLAPASSRNNDHDNGSTMNNAEFDSLFTQFMHDTNSK